uniref:Uncharacterized protein n=1 Tax=Percolomonas cosmopolitus TaxID=63605 RepID=A0A7S1PHB8_9EUKA|mmetsp:Transcript_4211/g.15883  ORF Transcript_4211/g.15883 Transcript_4211/m.15883 type:complete len:270 (+) Transcript_4211:118-927(+)|eukprot:CAMPEP_0117445996 /NCGR_PEP_ID=MMETSP0759-20121206/6098_1 /TAXON_ID=63605 /ORGANISM="Percolomonas cosmopolitus, Strain WS" /LENGTH=269 /DNA_ID=CAMNT_0005238219 /DNA_START=115 /DNA_END=924 /DNA_ORIENTATION=-
MPPSKKRPRKNRRRRTQEDPFQSIVKIISQKSVPLLEAFVEKYSMDARYTFDQTTVGKATKRGSSHGVHNGKENGSSSAENSPNTVGHTQSLYEDHPSKTLADNRSIADNLTINYATSNLLKSLPPFLSQSKHGLAYCSIRLIDLCIIENFWAGIVWLVCEKECAVDQRVGRVAKWWHRHAQIKRENEVTGQAETIKSIECVYFFDYRNITSLELAERFGLILPDRRKYSYGIYLEEREREMKKVLPPLKLPDLDEDEASKKKGQRVRR